MKDILKYVGLLVLIVFSFYYTDKISMMIIYESDLMQEIISKKDEKETAFVNAIITGNYITPGLNGLKINELDSYYQMKKDYKYISSKLVYDEVEPETTIEKNKNFVINQANKSKKAVSIIVDNNREILKYAKENPLKINCLITYDEFDKNSSLEQINIDKDIEKLDILLNKYKLNTNICIINKQNKDDCLEKQKYLVEETYYIDNISIASYQVNSGDILLISNDLSLANFKILLKKISYRDLDIVYLSKLISEKRNV